MVTKKRSFSFEDDDRMQHCTAIATRSLVQNKEDPSAFTIPCKIGLLHFAKALCDLGANINLMALSIYNKLGLGDKKTSAIRILMADGTVDFEVPIILERSFLATGRDFVDMDKGQMKFRFNNEEVTFNICRFMRRSGEIQSVFSISYRVEKSFEVHIEERLGLEALVTLIMNFDSDCIEEYGSLVAALDQCDV
ncbi:uncharacterized protein [Solanum lycopersicum]|uniref:uncharacterized protein n=1 Tax=Solanum lycopersicum TaxID=4081 RepID=UPI00374975C0